MLWGQLLEAAAHPLPMLALLAAYFHLARLLPLGLLSWGQELYLVYFLCGMYLVALVAGMVAEVASE